MRRALVCGCGTVFFPQFGPGSVIEGEHLFCIACVAIAPARPADPRAYMRAVIDRFVRTVRLLRSGS